ncbi:ribonucleotide reductase N-terminal alpha domain-containing protein, partial [Escherichia coli]
MPEKTNNKSEEKESGLFEIDIKENLINTPKNLNVSDDIKEPYLTENSRVVLERRYLKKDKDGKVIETAKDLFLRVAETIAKAD